MKERLPRGWTIAPLKEVCASFDYGTSAKSHPTGTIPVIRMGNIQDGKIDWTDLVYTSDDSEISKYRLKPRTVLFNRTNSPELVGKTAIYRGERPAIFAGYLIRINAHSSLDPDYLNYWLNSNEAKEFCLAAKTDGVSQSNINARKLGMFELPICSLSEQRRIVAKLEKLLGKVDACQKRLEKVPLILRRFRQSVLAAACSGRLTEDWREEAAGFNSALELVGKLKTAHERAGGHRNGNAAAPTEDVHDLEKDKIPDTWDILEMRELVEPDRPITYGILKPGPNTPDGVPYVRVADFPNDRLNLSTIRCTTKAIEQSYERARLRPGDILLSIRGTVGRVCIVPKDLAGANITQDSARLTIQAAMDCSYVSWFLRSPETQKRMQKAVKGVAIRGINIGDVRALQVAIPPKPEQKEIVRRVEALFKLADQIETRYQKSKAHVDKLTRSILAKAFRGELVPQDPSDELAEVLLERIRRERDLIRPDDSNPQTVSQGRRKDVRKSRVLQAN